MRFISFRHFSSHSRQLALTYIVEKWPRTRSLGFVGCIKRVERPRHKRPPPTQKHPIMEAKWMDELETARISMIYLFFFPILRHITQTVDVVSGARDASDISQSMERVRKDQTPRRPLCLVTVVCFGFRHMTCVGIARKAA